MTKCANSKNMGPHGFDHDKHSISGLEGFFCTFCYATYHQDGSLPLYSEEAENERIERGRRYTS